MFRGLAAIIEAYLIYWALVYFIARKYFQIQPGVGSPAGLGDLDLRGLGGHHHGAAIRAGRSCRSWSPRWS